MATKCPNCNSVETQTLVHNNQCLTCGKLFDFEGNTVEPGYDESTRTAFARRLAPRATVVVGNYADLQRAGAQAAAEGSATFAEGVVQPPNTARGPGKLITPAEADANRGETTVETERMGIDVEKASAKAVAAVLNDSPAPSKPKATAKKR